MLVYLFRDNPYAIVVVECGFLSNPEELKALFRMMGIRKKLFNVS